MWLDGVVALDGPTTYPAQVSTMRWNGWAVPRFDRATMVRIVEDFHTMHVEYADAGQADCAVDVMWRDEMTVIVHDYAYPDDENDTPYSVEELTPDADGYYHFGGGFTWQTIEPEWAERASTVERLAGDELLQAIAFIRRVTSDYNARHNAREALELALAREGVPVAFLPEVGGELFGRWCETLWTRPPAS